MDLLVLGTGDLGLASLRWILVERTEVHLVQLGLNGVERFVLLWAIPTIDMDLQILLRSLPLSIHIRLWPVNRRPCHGIEPRVLAMAADRLGQVSIGFLILNVEVVVDHLRLLHHILDELSQPLLVRLVHLEVAL